MQLKLDPRNAIPVLELVPYLGVSEIFSHLTTSGAVGSFLSMLRIKAGGHPPILLSIKAPQNIQIHNGENKVLELFERSVESVSDCPHFFSTFETNSLVGNIQVRKKC